MRDERTDPVEIIAKVGGIWGQDPERVLEVWMYLAHKAGWRVTRIDGVDLEPGDCGMVEVEGLRYRIRQAPRLRHSLVDDSGGTMVRRPVFGVAGWAEPVLTADCYIPKGPGTPNHAWWLQ